MLDAFAREQDLFVTTGIEPVDVDVGINDKAAHLTQRSEEDFFEPSFGCHLAQRSIDVRLRNDEAERWIGHSSLRTGDRYSHTHEEVEYRRSAAGNVGLDRVLSPKQSQHEAPACQSGLVLKPTT